MRLGIIGGTGPAGTALGSRLAAAGLDVVIGSRSADRAVGIVSELLDKWPDRKLSIVGAENEKAAEADVIVVATPWDALLATVRSLADKLEGKVVISMANALVKTANEFEPLMLPRGSAAVTVAWAAPGAKVAAAFHHLPARELGDLNISLDDDVLVCGDNDEAISVAGDLIRLIPDLRPLNAGSLSAAAPIEAFTAVLLQLNIKYKTHAGVRFTGIDVQ